MLWFSCMCRKFTIGLQCRRALDGFAEGSKDSLSGVLELWLLHACPWQCTKTSSPSSRPQLSDIKVCLWYPVVTGLEYELKHIFWDNPKKLLYFHFHEDQLPCYKYTSITIILVVVVQGEFSSQWLPHVLSNFPFYNVLLPMFLRLTFYRIPHRPDTAVRDLLKVLNAFRCPEFRKVLSSLESTLSVYVQTEQRRSQGSFSHLVPFLFAQMQDWSEAAKSGGQSRGLEV